MKILHLGDLHLGKALGEFDLIDDQKYILDQILDIIEKESVDGVLIAGDVYDRAIPSEDAVNLLDYFLGRLSSKGVATFLISGNHDSDDRLNFGSRFFESHKIFISSVFDGKLRKVSVGGKEDGTDIYMFPYIERAHVRQYFPDKEIRTYEDAVRTVIENTEIDEGKCNIIIAHQFVTGQDLQDPEFGGSESLGTKTVGTVEKVSYKCFDAFDYVALGHIHKPQIVGRDQVVYSGSPLKYSLSEAGRDKSVPIITINSKTDIKIDYINLKPLRDLRKIRGTMKELLDEKNVTDTDDYIYVTLTDEEIINNAMGHFQLVYPHTVDIDYDNEHTRAMATADVAGISPQKRVDEIFTDFYKMIYGTDISKEEMDMLMDVAREVGVIDEAD